MGELFELLKAVGPSIAALKTHVDLIDDWNKEGWGQFCNLAQTMDLLIFEDRKFADIGKISRKQMGGVYNIQEWSDIVTAHLISGPDIMSMGCNLLGVMPHEKVESYCSLRCQAVAIC